MKRYGNLYNKICSFDNIELAHSKARKGKTHYEEVQIIDLNPNKYISMIQESLLNKTFTTSEYTTKIIYEPKERIIYKLPYYPDRIIHHAIMNILQPIWDKIFITDLYSAIPTRGLHKGIERLHTWLEDDIDTKYCLKFDVEKYYPSVNHNKLLDIIKQKIKCKDTLWLLEDIIRSPFGSYNIPIGNYLSQYFGNLYLNNFDHWIKEFNHVKYYMRYGDDGIILHSDKHFLNNLLDNIKVYITEKLLLKLNNKTQIFPVDKKGIDFLGYRFYRNYILLRKSTLKRFKKKIKYIKENYNILNPQSVVSSIMSYYGWLRYCNCNNLKDKYLFNNELITIMDILSEKLNIENPLRKKII